MYAYICVYLNTCIYKIQFILYTNFIHNTTTTSEYYYIKDMHISSFSLSEESLKYRTSCL